MALERADEQALLEIALDHRALYMDNWQRLLLDTLTEDVMAGNLSRQTFHHYVKNWSGKAATDDVGYRLVREYKDALELKIMSSLGRYFLSLSPAARDDVEMALCRS